MTANANHLLAGLMLIGNLLCWPTDRLIFSSQPLLHTFNLWRIALGTCCLVGFLLMRSERVRSSPHLVGGIYTLFLAGAVAGGYLISGLGGLDQSFFYTIYIFSGVSMALFVPFRQRFLMAYGFTISFLLAFFGHKPEHLRHWQLYSVMIVLALSVFCYILLGHLLYLLTRKSFLQGLALERRAQELAVANEKSERLLLNVLPAPIAHRLKEKQHPIADGFPDVSVLFADIVAFTPLSASMRPQDLVQLLNEIFTEFDRAAEKLGLEKIKTIGDAYMVASGLPEPRSDHALSLAEMALAMREIISRYRTPEGRPLRLRVGIHTGPVVAGVIGFKKFIYDLWGDTVNTASRMESHGLPDEIQVSEATRRCLNDDFELSLRGEVEIKGIGPMNTWLLKGRKV
jgi:class 3 adenylate cyclase